MLLHTDKWLEPGIFIFGRGFTPCWQHNPIIAKVLQGITLNAGRWGSDSWGNEPTGLVLMHSSLGPLRPNSVMSLLDQRHTITVNPRLLGIHPKPLKNTVGRLTHRCLLFKHRQQKLTKPCFWLLGYPRCALLKKISTMCGISALLSLEGRPVSSTEQHLSSLDDQLSESLDSIQHRGPDARGQWACEDGNVCKCFIRSQND